MSELEEQIQDVLTKIEQDMGTDMMDLRVAFAITAKDYFDFIQDVDNRLPRDRLEEAEDFLGVYNAYMIHDKQKHSDSPFFETPSTRLPSGVASAAISDSIFVPILNQHNIGGEYHEWTRGPGRKLFNKFARKFKAVICGENGPYKAFEDGLLKEAEIPKKIVAAMLAGITFAGFWVPLFSYFALLLTHTILKVYCEDDSGEDLINDRS